jgi:hypothetical protein
LQRREARGRERKTHDPRDHTQGRSSLHALRSCIRCANGSRQVFTPACKARVSLNCACEEAAMRSVLRTDVGGDVVVEVGTIVAVSR